MTKWLIWLLLFGLVIPFAAYRFSRRIGVGRLLTLAAGVGLAYGALKADNPWIGDGLLGNLRLMATSALVLLVYAGSAVGAARLVAKAISSFRA